MLADLLDLDDRRALPLHDVVAAAPAMTRVDRKYLVPVTLAREVLARLDPAWGVLTLPGGPADGITAGDGLAGGRRTTHYRSTYFDSPDLATARAHVQGRRRRWKARSRLYVEDGLCRTEVKAKDGRGRTVKTVAASNPAAYGRLTPEDLAFLTGTLAGHAITVDAARLAPTMEIAYERLTLARVGDHPARLTVDWGMHCVLGREQVRLDHDHVLLETKGDLRAGDADRLLAGLGVRPRPFSKYAAAAGLLHPAVADNDVRRLRGTVLHHGAPDTERPATDRPASGRPASPHPRSLTA